MVLETRRVAEERPRRDPRLYSVYRLLGSDLDPNDPGLLDNWHHFAETGREPEAATGYGRALGRSNVPEVAAFAKMAVVYADLDAALPKDRRGEAVRLYFRGMLDTNLKSPTFGLFIRPNFHQVRYALRCDYNRVGDFIYFGVAELVEMLCKVPPGYARYRAGKWWQARLDAVNTMKETRY